MRLRASSLGVVAVLAACGPAAAQDLTALQARLEAMEARLKAQEAQIAAQADEIGRLKAAQDRMPVATATAAPPVRTPLPAAATLEIASDTRPDEAATPAARLAQVTLPNGRPTFVSADHRFDASLRAVLQMDAGHIMQAAPSPLTSDFRRANGGETADARDMNSGVVLRRGRIGVDGNVFDNFDYNITLELGGEAGPRMSTGYLQYNGLAPLHVRAGVFGPSDDLEGTSPKTAFPMLEAAAIVDATRSLASSDGRFSAQVFGYGDRWLVSAAITGASFTTAGQSFDDQIGLIGRAAGRPLKWKDGFVHLGAAYTYLAKPPDQGGPDAAAIGRRTVQFNARPEIRFDNTRLIGTGAIPAEHAFTNGFEFAFQERNWLLMAQYNRFGVDRPEANLPDPRFKGWYVSGSWMITGEQRRYNPANANIDAAPVAHPFDAKAGTWGGLEVSAQYSVVDLNWLEGLPGLPAPLGGVRGGEQRAASAGLNWYLNPAVRLMFGLQDVRVNRLSPDAALYKTPVGAQIGQHFKAVTFRSQLAF